MAEGRRLIYTDPRLLQEVGDLAGIAVLHQPPNLL